MAAISLLTLEGVSAVHLGQEAGVAAWLCSWPLLSGWAVAVRCGVA